MLPIIFSAAFDAFRLHTPPDFAIAVAMPPCHAERSMRRAQSAARMMRRGERCFRHCFRFVFDADAAITLIRFFAFAAAIIDTFSPLRRLTIFQPPLIIYADF